MSYNLWPDTSETLLTTIDDIEESPLGLLWEEAKLKLPSKKILDSIEKYGNISYCLFLS